MNHAAVSSNSLHQTELAQCSVHASPDVRIARSPTQSTCFIGIKKKKQSREVGHVQQLGPEKLSTMIANVLSSLLFFSVSYAVISFQFQNRNARKGKWVGALVLVLAAFAIKLVGKVTFNHRVLLLLRMHTSIYL
jgi:hypothetical protein